MLALSPRLTLAAALLVTLGGCASLTPNRAPAGPTAEADKACADQTRAASVTPSGGSPAGSASATGEASTYARASRFISHLLVEPAPNPMAGVLVARCLRAHQTALLNQP
ncbi:MAG: hypothetical protein EXR83_05225 [Gammaproteobacteria bacterium]|nr:hypothetical protein [Gammaproteobacteria bacterium]